MVDTAPIAPTGADAAIRTLTRLGYTYHGGEQWKPPLGKAPAFASAARASAAQPAVPRAQMTEEIDNVLSDPDTRLSPGAERALRWLRTWTAAPLALAAAPKAAPAPGPATETARAAFEAEYFGDLPADVPARERGAHGTYRYADPQHAWTIWQRAWAAARAVQAEGASHAT